MAGASCLAVLIFGLMPALRTARRDVAPVLKQVATGANARRLNPVTILMVVQVAVSVPLLVGSGLFLRTVHNLANVDLGFNPERLVIFRLDPGLNGYDSDRIERFFVQILQRVGTVPGVTSATLSDVVLLSRVQNNWRFSVDRSELKNLRFARVGPAFFETIGIPVVAGRGIGVQDDSDAPRVAVVNESAARTLFDSSAAIGRRITMRSIRRSRSTWSVS